ncbi:hypothetical protein FOA52_004483 [Chlamydomonas sp. UWO 241]|nr:hypothetical protein FOA52_004483 [Chlamydomonas sp. UWO 241]
MRIVEESNRIQVIKELRDLVEHKEHFMSSMSHELRTPLNGIIGLSDSVLIGSCGSVNEQLAKTMNSVKLSGSRLLNLINDILDAASMRKVLHNLIGNSCKFTHHGCIWVNAQLVGDRVEVSVNDSGIGIAEDKFESIFEAFKQVDEGTARKYGGTGLGLNLVKQLVEAHGGTIRVASLPHELTSFTFDLQASTSTLVPPHSPASAAAAVPAAASAARPPRAPREREAAPAELAGVPFPPHGTSTLRTPSWGVLSAASSTSEPQLCRFTSVRVRSTNTAESAAAAAAAAGAGFGSSSRPKAPQRPAYASPGEDMFAPLPLQSPSRMHRGVTPRTDDLRRSQSALNALYQEPHRRNKCVSASGGDEGSEAVTPVQRMQW